MTRARWTGVLVVLFLALLGWYLVYTEQIVNAFRSDTVTMTRMFAEVQRGLSAQDPIRADEALVNLQRIIVESGVPLVLSGPGDTIQAAVNLPFAVDLETREGQEEVQAFAQRLAERNPPVGEPAEALLYFGDPPELQRLRWIPWLQVTGLFITFVTGIVVIRFQRRADEDRAWTSMARELAHQLGTPISSLQGWLQVLRLPPGDRPGSLGEGEVAQEIGEDVDRLERVSRRFELIGRETDLGPLDLGEVVHSVEGYLRNRMPRLGPGVRLEVEVERDLPPVRGNSVLLAWALENVVKNALDALAGRGGVISLRAFHRESDWVTLQVRDSGPGVDPDIREKLFDPGVTTKSGGWGVGLSLSRRIVERIHGGRIELMSSGSKGTTFQFLLPRAESDGES